ncbi:hypothetical protein WICMUC_005125 [Wickerhamomyces mucosus]|uniref:Uncharacterized protein n=1 Tax=Wickerhamomyces mucosus TaxID=1378264 RepID=A0A9P8PC15_9ASCO|nr:hypothetical protein WICMUC_005125 [Wickerhamomyces mucosus]
MVTYSCVKSQVQNEAACPPPVPNSTKISKSSSSKISLALSSSTFCGSPLTRSSNSLEPSVGTKETLVLLVFTSTSEYPMAHKILPQLASFPYKAVLTNGEFEIVLATLCASSCDKVWANDVISWRIASYESVVASVINLPPAAPLAKAAMVSLVDISPSTDIQLNERSTAYFKIDCKALLSIGASVTKNPNKVAMFGQIIPAPLDKPAMVYLVLFTLISLETNFGKVSVVIIPLAQFNQAL